MYIKRKLFDIIRKNDHSLLLLGPRQTGKSTLIEQFDADLAINLAHEPTFLEFASEPRALENRIALKKPKSIFIDEVQRLPSILNTIQVLIDKKPRTTRFFLTGSSARKLRRGKANLLPGRVLSYELGPLIVTELKEDFFLNSALSTGTMPGIYQEPDHDMRTKILSGYAATYLKEEIQAEALTKDLEGFARFLRFCAASAGQFLDLSKLASEAQIKRASAIRFFEILEDTLIVSRCDAFAKSERKRLVQHPRYFFFDNGVLNGVLGNFQASEDRKGNLFEHFVYTQLYHATHAYDMQVRISTYRTEHHAELDFILEFPNRQVWAIECKAGVNVGRNDLSGFTSFANFYKKPHKKMIIYGGDIEKKIDDIFVLPVAKAVALLFES